MNLSNRLKALNARAVNDASLVAMLPSLRESWEGFNSWGFEKSISMSNFSHKMRKILHERQLHAPRP